MTRAEEIAQSNGGAAFQATSNDAERARLWKARHSAYHAARALRPGAECLVRVRLIPDSAGAKAAKLRIGSASGAFLATLAGTGTDADAADQYPDGAFGHPGPPPPRPLRQGRHRRFVRGETLRAGGFHRPRRVQVRASTVPR